MAPKSAAAVALLAFLAGCSAGRPMPTPPAQPIADTRIVPYSRIGKLAVGMTEANLFSWMGTPERTEGIGTKRVSSGVYEYEGDNAYFYNGGNLRVNFQKGKAYSVSTRSSSFATDDGISVGTPEIRLRAAWGTPTKLRQMGPCGDPQCNSTKVEYTQYCFANGLTVAVDEATRRVNEIVVYYRGCNLP